MVHVGKTNHTYKAAAANAAAAKPTTATTTLRNTDF
jgi:hypothetical protein